MEIQTLKKAILIFMKFRRPTLKFSIRQKILSHTSDTKEEDDKLSNSSFSKQDDLSREELMAIMNLPRVELDVYDGDPLKYHIFMAAFDQNVDQIVQDGNIKLTRLLQYTTADAKAAIRSCALIGGQKGYDQARSILSKRFGNCHLVADHIINHLLSSKPVRSAKDLQQLSDDLVSSQATLSQMNKLDEISSQKSIIQIVQRLQPHLQFGWRKLALETKRSKDSYPSFGDLVEFVKNFASDLNDPVYGQMNPIRHPQDSMKKDKVKPKASSYSGTNFNMSVDPASSGTVMPQGDRRWQYSPCVLCMKNHRLWYCDVFKGLKPNQRRLDVVKQHNLCENCLLPGHDASRCRKTSVCSVEGCGKKHTKFIHVDEVVGSKNHEDTQVKVSSNNVHTGSSVYMPVVQVRVNDNCNAYALLDTASTNTFCTRQLVSMLNMVGKCQEINICTLGGNTSKVSDVVSLDVQSVDNCESLHMSDVYVVDDIPAHSPCTSLEIEKYPHLQNIELPCFKQNVKVHLLIGQDNAEAFIPLDIRKGRRGEPFAVKTLFGWCLNGSIPTTVSKRVISHFVTNVHSIEEQVNKLWAIEDAIDRNGDVSLSYEDRCVVDLWQREIQLVEGHYQLPIPWKNPDRPLPNNIVIASTRLHSLRKSLSKKGLTDRYDTEIQKMLNKGYAEKVPEADLQNGFRIWYLPHHGVTTDKKPGKLRVVFDCSAKFKGESLNDKCYQGPDLINRLLPVLLCFRLHPVGIIADIEAMYNQVRIPLKDRDALRFLWFEDGEVAHYRMTSHLFGGIWCASSSTFALRHTASDDDKHSEVVKRIVFKNFYVDDCLISAESKDEARLIMKELKTLLLQGGFNLTKYVVNDPELLMDVPAEDRAKEVCVLNSDSGSKALGIHWNVLSDEFLFKGLSYQHEQVTRRKMLSFVFSLFDPLGLISPLLIMGKLLFQEATRLKLLWDDVVPDDLNQEWLQWLKDLSDLESIRIPRCVKPAEYTNDNAYLELHHFSDASQKAYGSCSYLRCVNKKGQTKVSLIMSKSRVAPLKKLTIPRLELQAAVLSTRIDSLCRKEFDMSFGPSYFWTDSEIVLKYVKNEKRRFQVFVENRISTIRQLSSPEDWHHISGQDNPADLLTRGLTLSQLDHSIWFEGPKFLHEYKSTWKMDDTKIKLILDENDPEVKREIRKSVTHAPMRPNGTCNVTDLNNFCDPIETLVNHYSSWYRLKRAIAWLLHFKQWLRRKQTDMRHNKDISVQDLQEAEKVLIKHVQKRHYTKEISGLTSSHFKDSSIRSLRSLDPVLDTDGILRVGGRMKFSSVNEVSKQPVIIPFSHPIARIIVQEFHNKAHLGTEWVLSHIRRKYWIVKARSLIKNISRKCVTCRKLYAPPAWQKMADLPPERSEPGNPPFTYVGLDCFGPFYVKLGRSEIKRYGCIFTCLNTRAVHIEKLNNMSSECFINALTRFTARRGTPEKFWSDNGTNFRGAYTELARCLKALDQDKIKSYCMKQEIVWNFIPPGASHMGGIWERMIRTTRRIFISLLKSQRLTDEILETLFCEVESLINGRPITKISDDVNDSTPLTPNHLLLLRNCNTLPTPALKLGDHDTYRRRWKQVQHLTDQFWHRWLREYIPELQRRIKWMAITPNLNVGDLVLLMDENTPRNIWPLGLVVDVTLGRDGLVRSVKVKTKSTYLVRPITKVVLLEGVQEQP